MRSDNVTPREDRGSQEELRQETLAAQAALKTKSRLIDNMAYQIRTLSNAVIGFSDLLIAEGLPKNLKDYVDEIYQAGKALSVLVNDVLDMAKLDSGNLVVSKTHCELADRLDDFYQLLVAGARQRGLDFSIVADATVPAHIFTDSERLIKCLLNLTTNAVKYTVNGFVRVSISLQQKNNQPWIRFDVQDSGQGISPERLATIFSEVVQMENANRGVLSSMDMGLSITGTLPATKRLIEALGGQIEATSTPGTGSTFSLLLPAGVDVAAEKHLDLSGICCRVDSQAPIKTSAGTAKKAPAKKENCPRILLVEDQESNRTVITLLLETLGLAVESAKDGVEAVAKASAEPFDLILMDLKLPNMDGYEATKILRQKNLTLPIIALSAGVMSEQDSNQIKQDFDALLTKPVDRKKLHQMLRKYLPQLDAAADGPETGAGNDFVIEYTND
jgi:CheY-like chemotaxis protein/nitrogen-specific signal transduction histidine kinase